MITDEQYRYIVDQVYWVDKNRIESAPQKNWSYYYNKDNPSLGQFHVLKVADNPCNGMQAMAVSPFVNGQADTGEIVLAYAGTNFRDVRDIDTDVQMIGIGRTKALRTDYKRLLSFPIPFTGQRVESQAKTAVAFAQDIRKLYPQAHFTTTGHSLGESLAMYVALKEGYQNVGYNGPDIHRMISREEIKHMRSHPEQFINYRNPYDPIGGITGNRTQSAHPVRASRGLFNPFEVTHSYHALTNWQHNEQGHILDCQGQVASCSRASYLESGESPSLVQNKERDDQVMVREAGQGQFMEKASERPSPIRLSQPTVRSKEEFRQFSGAQKLGQEVPSNSPAEQKKSSSASKAVLEKDRAAQQNLKVYAKKHPEVLSNKGGDRGRSKDKGSIERE